MQCVSQINVDYFNAIWHYTHATAVSLLQYFIAIGNKSLGTVYLCKGIGDS